MAQPGAVALQQWARVHDCAQALRMHLPGGTEAEARGLWLGTHFPPCGVNQLHGLEIGSKGTTYSMVAAYHVCGKCPRLATGFVKKSASMYESTQTVLLPMSGVPMKTQDKEELRRVTYRELAEFLGISVSAARARASRARRRGRWRIVPSNHPSSPAQIELPARELVSAAAPGKDNRAAERARGVPVADDVYVATLQTVREAYIHLNRLHVRVQDLQTENGALRERAACLAVENRQLAARVLELEQHIHEQDEKWMAEQLQKLEAAVDLGRAEALAEERLELVDRLERGVRIMQAKLAKAERPLWRKILRM